MKNTHKEEVPSTKQAIEHTDPVDCRFQKLMTKMNVEPLGNSHMRDLCSGTAKQLKVRPLFPRSVNSVCGVRLRDARPADRSGQGHTP